jgi:hypothetical protein
LSISSFSRHAGQQQHDKQGRNVSGGATTGRRCTASPRSPARRPECLSSRPATFDSTTKRQRFGRLFDEASNQPLKAKRKTRDDERGDERTNHQRTTVAASFSCSVGDDERHGEPVRTL